MVMYGLLTKSQGSFVTYRNLTEQSMPYALQFDYYCDLLRMTEAQRHRLRWKTNDQILSSFTSEQQETWQRLTAKRSSTTLPDLTAPNPIDEVELSRVSPTFRTLSDTSIDWDFSDAQWKLLQDLKEVTWAGLQWGKDSQRFGPYPEGDSRNDPTDPAGQANEMFLKLAEDVAASGILTEPQEKRLEAADGK